MTGLTSADLKPMPSKYQSSRPLLDVLIGDDPVLPLIEASSTGDVTKLRSLLTQSPWKEAVLESPHCIYSEDRPPADASDVRGVLATKWLNLQRLVAKAAESGNAAAVSTLLDFAAQHDIKAASLMNYYIVKKTVENGHAAVLESLAAADPSVATCNLGHGTMPLDLAISRRQPDIAAVLIRLGVCRHAQGSPDDAAAGSYRISHLSQAIRSSLGPGTVELLLQHGSPVAGSGALHSAAERGALDIMQMLIQHGADVNERLAPDSLPRLNRSLLASRTPAHFAAAEGQVDAVKLLEDNGAQTDIVDENGKTPAQLLNERK